MKKVLQLSAMLTFLFIIPFASAWIPSEWNIPSDVEAIWKVNCTMDTQYSVKLFNNATIRDQYIAGKEGAGFTCTYWPVAWAFMERVFDAYSNEPLFDSWVYVNDGVIDWSGEDILLCSEYEYCDTPMSIGAGNIVYEPINQTVEVNISCQPDICAKRYYSTSYSFTMNNNSYIHDTMLTPMLYKILEDKFKRTVLDPWGSWAVSCEQYSDVWNEMLRLRAEENCPAYASYNFNLNNETILEHFQINFDWYYGSDSVHPDSVFTVAWDYQSAGFMILFHPWRDEISLIKNLPPTSTSTWADYFSLTSYPPGTFYTIPYDFVWGEGEWHSIEIDRNVNRLVIYIDGTKVFDQAGSDFGWADMERLTLGYVVSETDDPYTMGWSAFDNVTVYSFESTKIKPKLTLSYSPSQEIPVGTEATVTCSANYPVSVHLYYEGEEVPNPFTKTYEKTGYHGFDCVSNETEYFLASETVGFIHVYEAVTTVPAEQTPGYITTRYNISWMEPIVSTEELESANVLFIAPFLTPFFFSLMGMFSVIGFMAWVSKSPIVACLMFLVFIFAYGMIGILPLWLTVILGVIAGFLVAWVIKGMIG